MYAIQRFFFNIFLFCFGFGLFLFVKLDSYAFPAFSFTSVNGNPGYENNYSVVFRSTSDARIAIYVNNPQSLRKNITFYSNIHQDLYFDVVSYGNSSVPDVGQLTLAVGGDLPENVYAYSVPYTWLALVYDIWEFSTNPQVRVFDDLQALYDYVGRGIVPQPNFDSSLQLDSFNVTSWQVGNLQAVFRSQFVVKWSDPNISFVQVRVTGSANNASFESFVSPFKGKFYASDYVMKRGDIVHLVATPYKSDGSYGTSLYSSFTYNDDIPFSNVYRKYVNTPNNQNTLTIPYIGPSGNEFNTVPVDGVSTNITYKVNYNPTTNTYNDYNTYEVYYSPVIIYPSNTTDQEVDDTQDEIINNYTTNNYYETTKNINLSFDIDFGDISTNDIGEGFNGVSGFFNGFGGFIGHLSNWILALFPFLPPIVAQSIVFMFGLVVLIAGIALILKIIGAIGNIIDAIIPL